MTTRVVVSALVMGLVAFVSYDVLLRLGDSVESARNMVLLLMVMFENVQVFNSRSEKRSIFAQSLLTNPFLVIGTLGAQLLHIGAMFTPGISAILHIAPVSVAQWGVMLAASFSLLGTMELMKWLTRRQARSA
jgi:Ca2+-transporting ATPase